MDIDRESLASNYSNKNDDELLSLHASGTLTNQAYEIVEAELERREIPLPQRPDPLDMAVESTPQSLKDHWQGRATLASAYWLLGVLGSYVVVFLAQVFLTFIVAPVPSHLIRLNLFLLTVFVLLAYYIFAFISVWRCAWNAGWRAWGYIARTIMIINALVVSSYFVTLLRTI